MGGLQEGIGLAARLRAVKPSPTIAITQLANELRRSGRDIVGLSQGEPDFDTPEHIRAAAKAAIDAGATRYTDVDGTPELKAAIVRKFSRDNGLAYEPGEISVGTGGKQVIANAFAASLDAGDEVIIPAPYWVSYPDMVRLAGGTPVTVACGEADGFKIRPAALEAAITPRTRWLVLNSPGNPTGSCYAAAELRALADVLLRHPHVAVLSDDIYEHVLYQDAGFATLAAVEPRLRDRILICNGVSKAYAMTGWRIGFAAGPKPLIRAMATLQSQSTTNPSSVSQAAALAALDGGLAFLAERNAVFRDRRDLCVAAFNAAGLTCRTPEGAFYLFPSCAGMIGRARPDGRAIESDVDFATFLLEEVGVAVVPGAGRGHTPQKQKNKTTSTERLHTACDRIATACARLR